MRGEDALRPPGGRDDDLTPRMAAGDWRALRALTERHELEVYRYVRRLVPDDGAAEDATSNVFSQAWMDAGETPSKPCGRLSLLAEAHREIERRRMERDDDPWRARDGRAQDGGAVGPDAGGPAGVALGRAMDELTGEHREIIDLVYAHRLTAGEAAAVLGVTEETARARMSNARMRLAKLSGGARTSGLGFDDGDLPWHATGRLDRAAAGRVAALLDARPDVAPAMARMKQERDAAVAASDAIDMPRGSTLALATAKARAARRGRGFGAWRAVESFFTAPSAAAVKWTTAVAVLTILVQAALIAAMLPRSRLASPSLPDGDTGAAGDALALIRFVENAPFASVEETLTGLGVAIIDGPRPGGFFKVRLGPPDMIEKAKTKKILSLRRRRDIVKSVLPASARSRP